MKVEELKDLIASANPDALFADGFDEALIGFVERAGNPPVALYDREKCIRVLAGQGMTDEEAIEYFEYNVVDAFMGPNTPAFASLPGGEEGRDGGEGGSDERPE